MASTLTKLAILGALGLGGVAIAASTGGGMSPNPKQYKAGQKFGPLVLKESRGTNDKGNQQWLCRCEKCGHEQVRDLKSLEGTKAAGGVSRCVKCDKPGPKPLHAPFVGMRVGKFRLLKEREGGDWDVKCDCGATERRNIRNLQLSADLNSVPQCKACKSKRLASRRPSGIVDREVLRALEDGPRGATAVASATKMGTSTVWNALQRLKRRGFVDYDTHRGATTAAEASLTAAGERYLNGPR